MGIINRRTILRNILRKRTIGIELMNPRAKERRRHPSKNRAQQNKNELHAVGVSKETELR